MMELIVQAATMPVLGIENILLGIEQNPYKTTWRMLSGSSCILLPVIGSGVPAIPVP